MQPHIRNYRKAFNIGDQDITLCEVCGQVANSIHHIQLRSQDGSNHVDNLVALCNYCHDASHGKIKGDQLSAEALQRVVAERT